MLSKMQQRLQREEGFTLIELLVVIVIIGILLAIAVPSYLHFKDQANQKAAAANVRAAMPSMEAFYADNNSYATVTEATLKTTYDQGLSPTVVANSTAAGATYCISATSGNFRAKVIGPGGTITTGPVAGVGAIATCAAGV